MRARFQIVIALLHPGLNVCGTIDRALWVGNGSARRFGSGWNDRPVGRSLPGGGHQQIAAAPEMRLRGPSLVFHREQEVLMYEFKYHRPATVRQAANLLVKNEDAKVIAGGHTLVPVMKQRLASPPHLVDLSHIEGLDEIEMKGRSLVIGATAKHAAVATSAIVGEAIPALAE
ncbi:MAG: FAD binding domain-containing protein, partial [Rhodospirillales bacterium]|nr:FAD binding domain-containing protein [Rhodospirillales bacterium]